MQTLNSAEDGRPALGKQPPRVQGFESLRTVGLRHPCEQEQSAVALAGLMPLSYKGLGVSGWHHDTGENRFQHHDSTLRPTRHAGPVPHVSYPIRGSLVQVSRPFGIQKWEAQARGLPGLQ